MFKAHYNGLLRSQSCIWQTAQAAEAPCEASHRPIHHTSGVKLTPQCELHTAAARHSFAPEAYTQFAQQVFEQRPHLPRMYKWLHSRSGIISLNIFLYFGPPRAPKAQWNPEEALQNIRFGRHKWQLHLHACLPLQPPTSVIPEWIKKKSPQNKNNNKNRTHSKKSLLLKRQPVATVPLAKRSSLSLHAHLARCLSVSAHLQWSPHRSARSRGQEGCSHGIDTTAPRALSSGVWCCETWGASLWFPAGSFSRSLLVATVTNQGENLSY